MTTLQCQRVGISVYITGFLLRLRLVSAAREMSLFRQVLLESIHHFVIPPLKVTQLHTNTLPALLQDD